MLHINLLQRQTDLQNFQRICDCPCQFMIDMDMEMPFATGIFINLFHSPEIRDRDLTHTDYICEIRTALNCERGLTSAKRATVFDALDRLHERLREAEESRDGVVAQVKDLKRQCQVRLKMQLFPLKRGPQVARIFQES